MERNISLFAKILFLVCCLIFCSVTAAAANNISTDQQALLALKAHITHDPSNVLTQNWTSNASVCNWIGITCDVHDQRVTSLNLSRLSLTGTIPSQLGNLSSLQTLDLRYNRISGTIPPSIFSIFTLKILVLANNQLSGSFPSSISNMSSLHVLDCTNNRLSGELPPNICNYLPFLESLFLSGNMFHGEIPSTLSNCKQLQLLSLSFNSFSGAIPKEIGNLTKLKQIYLGVNKLQGEIPQELGNLAKLEMLSLPDNVLTGTIPSSIFNLSSLSKGIDFSNNSLTGSFSEDICQHFPHLEGLYLSSNQFTGPIPHNLWQCRELIDISLSYNQFTGRIPRGIGNLTSLKTLHLDFNNLTGEIPHEIGNLRNLERLGFSNNDLVGVVPATIFNLSEVKELDFSYNILLGSLPSSVDFRLPNIEGFGLANNNFSGSIPSFIFNASKLSVLVLGDNYFSGFIPNAFDNLRSLEWLHLRNNHLKSSTPELSFLSSLTNCKNLKFIGFERNPLNGILPSSIGNLSTSLETINLSNCNVSGSIPKEIGNLINLTTLILGGNKLRGPIPTTFGRLQKLQYLHLRNNNLHGSIPDDLCHSAALFRLELGGNKLSGSIPACLGTLVSLRFLLLDSNELISLIPSTFWNLKDILGFNFSTNLLTGHLPSEIGNLKVVIEIDLSRNNLSGDIPPRIGDLKDLQFLNLENNILQGPIPESIGHLTSLESLDLSSNNLSGRIPASLESLSYIKYLNLSFNRLEGEIPKEGPFANFTSESFVGNDLLCGSPNFQVPPCKSNKTSTHRRPRKIVILLGIFLPLSIAAIIVTILAVRFGLIFGFLQRRTKLPNDDNMPPQATLRRFSHLELSRATHGFSENNLIGTGGFGSVYKAKLEDETEVAVKVFRLQFEGALKSFDAECEVLKSIRHRNLVKIISSCSNDDFKALVLEYMPNESLDKCLYSPNCSLDIFQRLNIMIDVASALEYLHFGNSTQVLHCDLKPSNVLLDENMVAHLSDFGVAKLLTGEDQSITQTQTLATIGYMAPEYGREGKVSAKGDVYSYGIMLMETFTKKKPTDEIFGGEMSLKSWVNGWLHVSVTEVVDTDLLRREDEHFAAMEQCVSSIFSLASECTVESPEKRITTKEIVTRLVKIRDTLFKNIGL